MTYVDFAAKKNCYALMWSYGEICVGCGCCSKDRIERARARLDYHTDLLKKSENFSYWFDDEEIRKEQEKNIAEDIRYHKEKIKYYQGILERNGK